MSSLRERERRLKDAGFFKDYSQFLELNCEERKKIIEEYEKEHNKRVLLNYGILYFLLFLILFLIAEVR